MLSKDPSSKKMIIIKRNELGERDDGIDCVLDLYHDIKMLTFLGYL